MQHLALSAIVLTLRALNSYVCLEWLPMQRGCWLGCNDFINLGLLALCVDVVELRQLQTLCKRTLVTYVSASQLACVLSIAFCRVDLHLQRRNDKNNT